MRGHSLKTRLLTTGSIILILALGLTGLGLTILFERHVERRVSLELNTYIIQIASRLSFTSAGLPRLDGKLADPRFEKIYSGLYWQINNETAGRFEHSRSLWDTQLTLPSDSPDLGKVHIHTISGPQNSPLLVHERRLRFKSPQGEQVARLIVAIDISELDKMSADFAADVAIALFGLGAFLLLAGWVQILIGLGPLSLIQKSIALIRSGATSRMNPNMPKEVAPLAIEVNNLLEAQEKAILKAKHRASDLAHGFKTPLTALRSDIGRLRNKGEHELANDLDATSMLMQRQIDRELTKARIRDLQNMPSMAIRPVIDSIIATLARTPDGEKKQFEIDCKSHIEIKVDSDDLSDILGNLIENAVKHATKKVLVRVKCADQSIKVDVEDDGEGIQSSLRDSVQKRGVRLDRSIAGSGLGLAIVSDILDIYGETLALDRSPLGGLKAYFQISVFANK